MNRRSLFGAIFGAAVARHVPAPAVAHQDCNRFGGTVFLRPDGSISRFELDKISKRGSLQIH